MKHLTEAQVEAWRTQGFLSPLTAMSEAEARRFRDRLEASEQAFGPLKIGGMGSKSHLLFTWVDEIARHPQVLDAVEDRFNRMRLAIRTFHRLASRHQSNRR